jgi:myo-inositol 2-dehydrogenase / D-chiro-inositol 1-dehydrogenase
VSAATPLGVGILGAGPVTQAIHLPTLARMHDLFRVVHVMDVSPTVAESVAARVGAAYSTSLDELLADTAVDVVAICSPPKFHAEQVIAAMRAGKKGILCEKPYATTPEEAAEIAAASAETGVPVVVGAMHVFDPGWAELARSLADLRERVHTVRSRIAIPRNERFEDWATEIAERPDARPAEAPTHEALLATLSNMILGLAVHDLPLVRTLLPDWEQIEVLSAQMLMQPFMYTVNGRAGDRMVQLQGSVHGHWETYWELEAIADDAVLHVRFTPSYVHAGSAVATISRSDGTSSHYGPYERNGYEGEWRALHAVVGGDEGAAPTQTSLIDDLAFTLTVSERAVARASEELSA